MPYSGVDRPRSEKLVFFDFFDLNAHVTTHTHGRLRLVGTPESPQAKRGGIHGIGLGLQFRPEFMHKYVLSA